MLLNLKNFLYLFSFFIMFTYQVSAQKEKKVIINGVNFVKVSDRIDTSGQPPKVLLEHFADKNYDLVINLAPPLSKGSVLEEGSLIAQSGTKYVNIPVDWKNSSAPYSTPKAQIKYWFIAKSICADLCSLFCIELFTKR